MVKDKKELAVAALRNGTVIDHIPSESLFQVVDLLGLRTVTNNVTIGFNLDSSEMGKKGIIKIADIEYPEEVLNRIALIAPTAVINIIKDYDVVAKRQVSLPETLINIVKCPNPKCISNNEPMRTNFKVISNSPLLLRCHFCECVAPASEITLK
ncbi:MAG: aspartate carbamoyltransferase regulatory subunit [Bacteroidales bacterium]|nr:aspartate carbamoyltransferase regulatory subunit [Bacteroidales bacterium]